MLLQRSTAPTSEASFAARRRDGRRSAGSARGCGLGFVECRDHLGGVAFRPDLRPGLDDLALGVDEERGPGNTHVGLAVVRLLDPRAVCLVTLRGTPYLYQGDEIGMYNCAFEDISEFNDVQVLNAYKVLVENENHSPKQFLKASNKIARDHARTPMQWNAESNDGQNVFAPVKSAKE